MKNTNESQYLRSMLQRNEIIELRCLKDGHVYNGLFTEYEAAKNAIIIAEKNHFDSYVLLNPCHAEPTNRLVKPKQGQGVSDSDIRGIWVIPMDFDPVRETGTASTEEECQYASERATYCADFLKKRGFGEPVKGFSGNGSHLLYYTELANNEQTKVLLKNIYLGLKLRFNDDLVKFDTTVRNPSRILRLYGTTNQKSGRRTWVNFSPETKFIDPDIIKAVAEELAPPAPAKQTYVERKAYKDNGLSIRGWDIIREFVGMGLYKRQLDSQKHAVICPWVQQHSSPDNLQKTDTVIWDKNSSGYPNFHCSHEHCSDKGIRDVFNFLVGTAHAIA